MYRLLILLLLVSCGRQYVSFPEEPIVKGDTLVVTHNADTLCYEFYHHYKSQEGRCMVIAQ